jgi:hypothetical protein
MRIEIKAISIEDGRVFMDYDRVDQAEPPPPTPPEGGSLPDGFDSDTGVAFDMLVSAMDAHGLTPIGVQGKGSQIADALNDTWPGLWPGFGSLDVTIDSGKGGWQFRPDGQGQYGEGR